MRLRRIRLAGTAIGCADTPCAMRHVSQHVPTMVLAWGRVRDRAPTARLRVLSADTPAR